MRLLPWIVKDLVYFKPCFENCLYCQFSEILPHDMDKQGFQLHKKLDCQQGAVRAVRYNVDGDYVITSGSNKTIKLWTSVASKESSGSKRSPKLLSSYAGHGNEVLDARGSCDNGQIVSCGLDKSILLWDVGSGKILR